MPTLYRQYRPRLFSELAGQGHITQTLQQAISQDKISHAYLFHGPRGTGKTSTARILAKRLNCLESKDAEPCGSCKLCVATQDGKNIDVLEIDAASNRGIDDIRTLRSGIGLSPAMSKYKIYIIDEVHMLTQEAFSALLKTLEEPTAHVIFILATTELHKIPATILSRCQLYRFRRATSDELKSRLGFILQQEKRQADESALDFIISRSDGCYRDAESLLGQMLTLQTATITRDGLTELLGLPPADIIEKFVAALTNNNATAALAAVDQAYTGGHDPEQFLHEAITLSRDQAVAATQQGKTDQRMASIIRALLQARQDLAYVPQPLVALQLAVLTVCKASLTNPSQPPLIKGGADLTPAPSLDKEGEIQEGVSRIQSLWPELIQAVKPLNPVASTFLRAAQPTAQEGNTIVLRMQYGLHRNFFERPDNKKLVEEQLGKLLGTPVSISCQADEAIVTPAVAYSEQKQKQETDLFQAVQEVFGKK